MVLDLLDLEVGDRGLEVRVPVDQALAAEDQAAVVEVDEDLQHRVVEARVHGEAVAREVEAVAEAAGLLEDGAAGPLLPLPDLGDEGLAAHLAAAVLPVRASSRSTTIWVAMPAWSRPGCQRTSKPAHPVPAGEDVHQRVVEGVAHVQAPVTLGGGSRMREGLGAGPALAPARKASAASQAALTAGSAVAASKVFSIGMGSDPGSGGHRS